MNDNILNHIIDLSERTGGLQKSVDSVNKTLDELKLLVANDVNELKNAHKDVREEMSKIRALNGLILKSGSVFIAIVVGFCTMAWDTIHKVYTLVNMPIQFIGRDHDNPTAPKSN